MKNQKKIIKSIFFLCILSVFLNQCGIYKKVNTREIPTNAQDRARKAVDEGKGLGINNIFKNGGTNFEFSSSNPMWRASLEVLDFLPLTNVDYSGGIIISDWYSANNSNDESIKIIIRFLSNEIRSDSLKVNVFQKKCSSNSNCNISNKNSKISEELIKTILAKATDLDLQAKKKK